MKKHYFLLFLFAFSSLLIAQISTHLTKDSPSEIIDTVYAEASLQGNYAYHIESNWYAGGVVPHSEGSMYVGDAYGPDDWMQTIYSNIAYRGYLSFHIDNLHDGYEIESVTFNIYQRICFGNDVSQTFPIWYNNLQYYCILARADYGDTLEESDFYPEGTENIGAISPNDGITNGWKQLDVTNTYLADRAINKEYYQTLLYFPILSDYDAQEDVVIFDNANTSYPGHKPNLVIHYVNTTSGQDDHNDAITAFSIYPNPVSSAATVQVKSGSHLASLEVYNVKGQRMDSISRQIVSKAESKLIFDRSKLPSGLYILRSVISKQGRTFTINRKVMLY